MKVIGKLLFIFFFGLSCSAQYISVNDNFTADQLVNDILVNNPCVQVANVSVSSWAFSSGNSFGYFNQNGSSFPFSDGVLLTTGSALSAIGPNSGILSEGPANWPGDSDLEQALNLGNTFNATVLEFDFQSVANKFSFEYIFSSEQYLSNPSANQCGYTDGFAFLLKKAGSADAYQNLAVVPNTTTPVTVNTVRGPGTICPSSNEEYFDAFNGNEHPTNYNGQTRILTATASVDAGDWYHLKIVVADQGNQLYDSAVFLGGGSFKAEKDLGIDRLVSTQNALCDGATLVLDATMTGALSYQWFKDGILLPGETNPGYTVSGAGTYSVDIVLAGGCTATGEIEIEYFDAFTVQNPATIFQCADAANQTLVDLVLLLQQISNFSSGDTANFYPTMADAVNGTNQIADPSHFLTSLPVSVAVAVNHFGCLTYSSIDLQPNTGNVPPFTISVCDTDEPQDGISGFDLDADVSPQILASLPSNYFVRYYASETDAALQQNQLPSSYSNSGAGEIIYARIGDNRDCYDIVPVTLDVQFFDAADFATETIRFCPGNSAFLQAPGGFPTYIWSDGSNSQGLSVNQSGTYSVEVGNAIGCTRTKTFVVEVSEPAVFESVTVNDFNGDANSVTINYSGNGNYEFSVDGAYWQTSNIFENVSLGYHQVFIRDVEGCQLLGPFEIFVADFPRFFTPNGDGFNDLWKITLPVSESQAKIYIFDRYGKLLHQISGNSYGWNGRHKDRELPSTDYWFALELQGGRMVKGHFSLKR